MRVSCFPSLDYVHVRIGSSVPHKNLVGGGRGWELKWGLACLFSTSYLINQVSCCVVPVSCFIGTNSNFSFSSIKLMWTEPWGDYTTTITMLSMCWPSPCYQRVDHHQLTTKVLTIIMLSMCWPSPGYQCVDHHQLTSKVLTDQSEWPCVSVLTHQSYIQMSVVRFLYVMAVGKQWGHFSLCKRTGLFPYRYPPVFKPDKFNSINLSNQSLSFHKNRLFYWIK